MKICKLKILSIATCYLLIASWTESQSMEETYQDMTGKVDSIQKTLSQQRMTIDKACGKDIVILMGNAGSGKSTLVSLLADAPLRIDSYGCIVPDADGIKIASGIHSITKYPAFLQTKVGMVWCAFWAIISPSNLIKTAGASMAISADAIPPVNGNGEVGRI